MYRKKIKDLLDLQGNLDNMVSLWVFSVYWKHASVLERVIVIHHTCIKGWNYSLTHCHQVYFYKMGFKPHQISSGVSYLLCMCQEIYKGLIRDNNQKAQGKQLMCQHTNILGVVMPQTLWSAFAVLHYTPSCHIQNCRTSELICFFRWLLYIQDVSRFVPWIISTSVSH